MTKCNHDITNKENTIISRIYFNTYDERIYFKNPKCFVCNKNTEDDEFHKTIIYKEEKW